MKKIIALILIMTVVLSLCACGVETGTTTDGGENLEKPSASTTNGSQNPTDPEPSQTEPPKVLCSHEYVSGACKYCGALKPSEWLEYKLNEDGMSYTLVNGCKDTYDKYKVVIPDVYEGFPVTAIGDNAFRKEYGNYFLTEVFIPNTVTTIGSHAFYCCTSLTSIIIPDSVVTIGDRAFLGCDDLKTITVGTGLKEVGYEAFEQNVSEVHISSIEAWCAIDFEGYYLSGAASPLYYGAILYLNGEAVTDLVIPEGVAKINGAFQSYDTLNSVIVPNSVISIADRAFQDCDALTTVEIKGGAIGADAFYGCDALVTLTLGEGVTSIGDSAFSYCDSLTSVTIPDSVISISDSAFSGCGSLTSVAIPDSVISISESAFIGCDNLTYKRYDTGLYLGNSENPYVALVDTSGTDISGCNIHKDTKIIAGGAFKECSSLTSITLPEGLVSIADNAFYGCKGLNKIIIPDSVTHMGKGVFSRCSTLASVTLSARLTEISDSMFRNCSSLESIIIPNGVISIGDHAFHDSGLQEIVIPEGVTSIGDYAFDGSGLQEIVIPEGVTSIGDYAFYDSFLKSITLPTTLANIGSYAFVYYYRNSYSGPDHVYITSMEAWCQITFEDEYSNPLWYWATLYLNGEAVTEVVIPDGVTSIGNYAFYGSNITSISIPATVTNIGDNAFASCKKLTSITFEGTMEQWYEVVLGENWKSNVPAKQIICSDGTANL